MNNVTFLSPDEIRSLRSVTATSISTWSKPDPHKVGKDIYELLTNKGAVDTNSGSASAR